MDFNASDMKFRDGYIICGDRHMFTDRICELPLDVTSKLHNNYNIRKHPGGEFRFDPESEFDRLFHEIYNAYFGYLDNMILKEALTLLNEDDEDNEPIDLGIRFKLTKADIDKIKREKKIDLFAFIKPHIYDFGFYYSNYNIVEKNEIIIPEEFIDEFYGEEADFDVNKYFTDLFNNQIEEFLSRLTDDQLAMVTNAPLYNEQCYVRIYSYSKQINTENMYGFWMPIQIQRVNRTFYFFVDFSGANVSMPDYYDFGIKEINDIQNNIANVEDKKIRTIFEYSLQDIKSSCLGGNPHYIKEIQKPSIIPEKHIFNHLFTETTIKVWGFHDPDAHKSDDNNWGIWYNSGVYSYILLKKYNYDSYVVSLYSIDFYNARATYNFVTRKENVYTVIFAVWSYFSSSLQNKRKSFTISPFLKMGVTKFYKS